MQPLNQNQLEKVTTAKIEPVPFPDKVLGFFSVGELDRALQVHNYSLSEEIGTVMDLARGDDPKLQLSAYKYLRERVKEVAQAEGLFARLEQTEIERGDDGYEVKRVASTSTLIQRLQQEKVRERDLDADAEHRAERHLPGSTRPLEPGVLHDGKGSGEETPVLVPVGRVPVGDRPGVGHGDPDAGNVGGTTGRHREADARPPVRAEGEHLEHTSPEALEGTPETLDVEPGSEPDGGRDVPRRITLARGVRRRPEVSDG